MKSAASVNTVRQAGSVRLTDMTTYREVLARRGIMPMRVEESQKAHGDLVLDSWCRPVRVYGSTGSGAGEQTTRAVGGQ